MCVNPLLTTVQGEYDASITELSVVRTVHSVSTLTPCCADVAWVENSEVETKTQNS